MVDLTGKIPTNFNPENYIKKDYLTGGDPKTAFISEMRAFGLKLGAGMQISKLERVPDAKDKGKDKSGWYVYHEIEDEHRAGYQIGVGVYGTWKTGEKVKWCSKLPHTMSHDERMRYEKKLEVIKKQQQEETERKNAEAKATAIRMWNEASDKIEHSYIRFKNIDPIGIKQDGDMLLVPIYDAGELCNLQRIYPDGAKRFLAGGKIKGCYSYIEGKESPIYIAEGYSTAVSVHMATGCKVYIAFNAGNLYEASALIKAAHPDELIIIAADNDSHNEINIGLKKAEQAANGLGIEYILPSQGVDFNDMHCDYGLDAVKEQFSHKPETYKKEKAEPQKDIKEPVGILSDIAAYYNATSGNEQRWFAVQTALCVTSVLLGRKFMTNHVNYTSLYFLNVAKSSTGKEHIKDVLEDILEQTGQEKLVGGDGYTSAGAVFSALMNRPRHVTFIDEFGLYLEAANKSSTGNQKDANNQLMQCYSRQKGTLRPPQYSMMTVTKDKQKELDGREIRHPAITLIGTTTPSTLFENIDIKAVASGFLNRFIVSISDAERDVRRHKEPMPVPDRIKNWVEAIEERRGNDMETHKERPDLIVIPFTDAAMKKSEAFNRWVVEYQKELESLQLAEVLGRTNEHSMKMALICALARDPNAETVTEEDMDWAIWYAKENANKLVKTIKMGLSGSGYERDKQEALQALRDLGDKGIKRGAMNKVRPFSKHKKRDLDDILTALLDADLIFRDELRPEKAGRPAILYKASA